MTLGLLVLASHATAADRRRIEAAGLSFEVPTAWAQLQAQGDTKPAVFRLPRAEGDNVETNVSLIHFGPSQAKFVQQNMQGWTKLFAAPDGGPATDLVKTTRRQVGPLQATLIDLTATYTGGITDAAAQFPGAGPKRNWRLLGAALEGPPAAPWFWQIIGPARTVTAAKPDFDALIDSARPAAAK